MNMIYRLGEIDKAAALLWEEASSKKIWAFYAPMGAGKTTLIHHVCEILQVKNNISSPTFAIINEYASPVAGTIYHMDWYRLKNEEEAMQAGILDALQSGSLCLVEWPENAPGLLPDDAVHIYIKTMSETKRQLYTGAE